MTTITLSAKECESTELTEAISMIFICCVNGGNQKIIQHIFKLFLLILLLCQNHKMTGWYTAVVELVGIPMNLHFIFLYVKLR